MQIGDDLIDHKLYEYKDSCEVAKMGPPYILRH